MRKNNRCIDKGQEIQYNIDIVALGRRFEVERDRMISDPEAPRYSSVEALFEDA